jgi:Arc/MetJ-type ribon-helix-helix transcriptional regulator
MGIIQVQLPDDLRTIIERQVAQGRAASEAEYVAEALRLYADHLDAEDEIASIADVADADIASGRYGTVTTQADSDGLHDAAMARLRARLAADAAEN